MRIKDSINRGDKFKFAVIPVLGLAAIIVSAIYNIISLQETVLLVICMALSFTVFLFAFEYDYLTQDPFNNIHYEISKLVILFAVMFVIAVPLAIFKIPCTVCTAVTILLASSLPFYTGMELSIILFIYTAVLYRYNTYETVIYLTLMLAGLLFAKSVKNEKNRQVLIFVIFGIIFVMLYLLQYVNGRATDYKLLINNCIIAIINILIMQVGHLLMKKFGKHDIPLAAETILSESFPLVLLMKNSSLIKFNHARKVALLSSRVARLIDLDVELCMTAGFYYALCDNDEDDPIDFACTLGRKNALPPQIINIISAYKAIKKPIKTREGAVIEIVDELLTKVPKLETKDIPRQIVIISMLNDISTSGIIDESGLSMNSFIKMRDYLVKEMEKL
ncbi:MAG: hypothetical protein IJT81_02950 [Lachnospiraceae bacterium]|nr:hypothetical protein [Lachnospiraceae bacterium]